MAARFTLTQNFAAHVDKVLAARERRFEDVSKHDGLKKQDILDRHQEGSVLVTKRAFSLADKLPDALKTLLPSSFLKLVEIARFDTQTKTNRFEVIFEENPDRLQMKGETHYIHESDTSSRREYNISVKVNWALIGGMIENQIASSFRKGIEKDYEIIQEILNKDK